MHQFDLPRILLVGVAAVSMTACGAATSASGSQPKASPSGGGGNGVAGQLAQLSGNKLELSGQNGVTNVTFSSSTRVTETAVGTLADVVAGVCITAAGQKDATGAIAATTVTLTPKRLMNGTCTPAARNASPNPNRSPRPRPSGAGNFPSPPANFTFVRGEVASTSGTTVTVNVTGGGTQTVTVPTTARITKQQQISTSQLAVGQCIVATGQKNSSGTVQARTLSITPKGPTGCTFGGGRFGGGFGGGGRPGGGASPAATTA